MPIQIYNYIFSKMCIRDRTETVKSENYTNKFLQKDSNPVTMKASKSPAIGSSDQTKATSCYRVEEIAQLLAISPRAAYNLCNLSLIHI